MIDSDKILRQALALQQSGRPADAEPLLRRVLQENPYSISALSMLGALLRQLQRVPEAADCFQKVCTLEPTNAHAKVSLGVCLAIMQRLPEAVLAFRSAIQIAPTNAVALRSLGHALLDMGNVAEAEQACRAALAFKPDDAMTHAVLAAILYRLARHDEAIHAAQTAIGLNPNLAHAHYNLGAALSARRRMTEAIDAYRRAIQLRPNYPQASRELATLLAGHGEVTRAMEILASALTQSPDHPDLHNAAGFVLHRQGRISEAIQCYRRATELNPNLVSAASNVLLTMHSLEEIEPRILFDEHVAWARRFTDAIKSEPRLVHVNHRDENRPLRVAYISPDFRYHSVAHFLRPIIQHHDRARFDVVCYSSVATPDNWTETFRRTNVTWRDAASWNDAQLAARIHADAVDIAVDCSGHTADHRLLALARRPAPVQVTFLGYPNTTGLNAIDYRITDAIADPPGASDALHVEKLVRLEPAAWCYAAPDDAPPPRAVRNDGPICFGSFTTLSKLTPRWIGVWCEVLRRVKDSRLVLKTSCLNDAPVRARLLGQFAAGGVSEDRIELLHRQVSPADHLATYHRVDIALDTFPYHGVTTTCEALYMGVPVITLAGKVHASRVGASLLSAVGIPELSAHDEAHYVDIAAQLAGDPARLAAFHSTLRARIASSPLMDAKPYAAALENAYRNMWQTWCRSTR